jgi:hypothetical protein
LNIRVKVGLASCDYQVCVVLYLFSMKLSLLMYCTQSAKTGEIHSLYLNIERKLSPLSRIIYDQRESALSTIIISCARMQVHISAMNTHDFMFIVHKHRLKVFLINKIWNYNFIIWNTTWNCCICIDMRLAQLIIIDNADSRWS